MNESSTAVVGCFYSRLVYAVARWLVTASAAVYRRRSDWLPLPIAPPCHCSKRVSRITGRRYRIRLFRYTNITFKITVTLDSFVHTKLWQLTTISTVSFSVKCSTCPCCWTIHSSRRWRGHLQGGQKNWHNKIVTIFCTPYLYQILTDFQNSFTVRIRRKFVITLSLKIPTHLKCVATLPCEMSVS